MKFAIVIIFIGIYEIFLKRVFEKNYQKHKRLQIIGIAVCIIAILFLPYDTSMGNISISEYKMKVQYNESDRDYSTRMKLTEGKKLSVEAEIEKGNLVLRISQNGLEKFYDISKGFKGELELTEFNEGYVNVHLVNDGAKEVKVLIKPI